MTAKYAAVRRFLTVHHLVYHIGTHVSQKSAELAHDDATDFNKTIRPFLHGLDFEYGSDASILLDAREVHPEWEWCQDSKTSQSALPLP